MLSVVVLWTTSDALAAIEDIQYLFSHPTDANKLHNLAKKEALLAKDRTLALDYVARAEHTLGMKLKQPILPVLTQLSGT
jgi:zona occludens toxin (predicted ATPase)